VHYRRGTLEESRPCWQVVPLPSPAVPSTRPDEHLSDPESFCHSPSLPNPRAHKDEVTTGEGHWLNPDLVGKWSHSPALPFPQHAQTNTFPIPNPSVTLPLFRFLVFPYTPILPPRPFPLSLPPGRSCRALYNPRLEQRPYGGTPAPPPVMISNATHTFTRTFFPQANHGLPLPYLSAIHYNTYNLRSNVMTTTPHSCLQNLLSPSSNVFFPRVQSVSPSYNAFLRITTLGASAT